MKSRQRRGGFTIIELMIAVALVGVLLVLAAPSFTNYIVTQRLKSANAALLTDLQYARSEAMSRGRQVFVQFRAGDADSMSCYTLYIDTTNQPDRCDCTQAPGTACPNGTRELRTVQLPAEQSVRIALPEGAATSFSFDPISGGIFFVPGDEEGWTIDPYSLFMAVDNARRFRTVVSLGGHPNSCLPSGAKLSGGYATC